MTEPDRLTLAGDVAAALRSRGAVRRGRHLRFACVAHDDRHPSADYDPERGVWVCRSCHVGGGARDLARRLGLDPAAPQTRIRRRSALTAIADQARWAEARLARYREVFQLADELRDAEQGVRVMREAATTLGDTDDAWQLLALAAEAHAQVQHLELRYLDALSRAGRR